MVLMRRRLACCTRDREISIDFDQQERITTYNGLENCILNAHSYDNESGTSRGDGCVTDSLDDDDSSCSSSNNAFGSFSSHWTMIKRDEQGPDEWEYSDSPKHFLAKEKPSYTAQYSDVETMKEKFAKLLLGEDITGGCKGLSTALALSNAITNLGATIFGELWKLEPLPEERKSKWRREMDWLLSPTNHMVELVPAKQHNASGRTLEIMIPKARADIHLNLPALQKLDSMLIETLDSMINTEFWYAEGSSRAEVRSRSTRQSRRWWLPSPQVPIAGLSDMERKKLQNQGKLVHQIFKAAKAINDNVLLEMPIPNIIREALPKSRKASLGDDLYRILNTESTSAVEMLSSLMLKSEHGALEAINKLEAAIFGWKERTLEQASGKSPVQTLWSFIKDPISEMDKIDFLMNQAELLLQQLKARYPNLPQTFLNVMKIQYGKDIGHAIVEAYSRVLGNLAFRILSRIGDILQEDVFSSSPNLPVSTSCFPGVNFTGISDIPVPSLQVSRSFNDPMNGIDQSLCTQNAGSDFDTTECSLDEHKSSSVNATPSRNLATPSRNLATPSQNRVSCCGREACVSPTNSS